MNEITNRLKKNQKKLKGWLKSKNIQAYRLYDWDIPAFPFFVEVYGDYVVIYDRTEERDAPRHEDLCGFLIEGVLQTFSQLSQSHIIWKVRERQKGKNQYQSLSQKKLESTVFEGTRRYLVNLTDYLDCGLFLDHRPLRDQFSKQNQKQFLNLFSYTCSVGVAAAMGGAETTNVDLSNTYLQWGRRNYQLNGFDSENHQFLQEDVLGWLQKTVKKYDVIFLDPPTFSNSKRMEQSSFDVQRDQLELVQHCLARLKPGGTLYFSNNASKFRLHSDLKLLQPKDLTDWSHPQDYHNKKTHVCYAFTNTLR